MGAGNVVPRKLLRMGLSSLRQHLNIKVLRMSRHTNLFVLVQTEAFGALPAEG